MSPIRICHVSLTHPRTPINRSLPKTFQREAREGLKLKSWRRSRLRSPETMLEPSFEASNFNFECKEHSKRNHPNHLPRSQSSLESSLKASRNLTNHKSVKLYGFKPLKYWRTPTTNLQIRRTFEAELSKLPS